MLKISSPAFEANGDIPKKYTCYGDNISPPLVIRNVPEGTLSFVIIMQNLSSPSGRWVNWLMWNVEAYNTNISENCKLEWSTTGLNSHLEYSYAGPCPSNEKHEYQIAVYALKDKLFADKDSGLDEILYEMEDITLSQGILTFYFSS